MGAVKAWLMDEEEKIWDKVADAVKESEDISEAQSKAIELFKENNLLGYVDCLLYTSPSPRDSCASRMPSSA